MSKVPLAGILKLLQGVERTRRLEMAEVFGRQQIMEAQYRSKLAQIAVVDTHPGEQYGILDRTRMAMRASYRLRLEQERDQLALQLVAVQEELETARTLLGDAMRERIGVEQSVRAAQKALQKKQATKQQAAQEERARIRTQYFSVRARRVIPTPETGRFTASTPTGVFGLETPES